MRSRIVIVLIGIFWLTMMAMLWRAEFGPEKAFSASVPASLVWERILTAPDASRLEIRQGTNRLGYCQWRADVGQELAAGTRLEDPEHLIEGMVRHFEYYRLDVDGYVVLPELRQRARFDFVLKLDTNRVWQEFQLRLTMRPDVYEVSADAGEEVLRVRADLGGEPFRRSIAFSELRNPQKLLADLGGPAWPLLLAMMGGSATTNLSAGSLGFRWRAHNDSLKLGRNAVRAYRLHARLLGRHEAALYVSPVGEILRVELPQRIVLLNDALPGLQPR